MNVKFSKILIPVDGSEASMNASDYAIFFAKSNKSQLIAMHADEAYHYTNDLLIEKLDTITSVDSIVQTIKQDAERWFNDIKQKISASEIGLRTGLVVSSKSTEDTIADYAAHEGVDLIVMGTKGAGLKERVLGSTASHPLYQNFIFWF